MNDPLFSVFVTPSSSTGPRSSQSAQCIYLFAQTQNAQKEMVTLRLCEKDTD